MLCWVEVADGQVMGSRLEVESVRRTKSVRSRGRKLRAVSEGGEVRCRHKAKQSRCWWRIAGRLEYFWWDKLDRDGMERVSDWVVCVLLLLWASSARGMCPPSLWVEEKDILYTLQTFQNTINHYRDTYA